MKLPKGWLKTIEKTGTYIEKKLSFNLTKKKNGTNFPFNSIYSVYFEIIT